MKYIATINGKRYEVEVERVEGYKSLDRNGVAAPKAPALASTAPVQRAPAAAPAAGATTVEAPMPGKVLDVKVTAGQAVKYGDVVAIMEAMKMETEIVAPADGTVSQILVKAGDPVDTGAAMVVLN
jgi:biotin carboxyl carrier protein